MSIAVCLTQFESLSGKYHIFLIEIRRYFSICRNLSIIRAFLGYHFSRQNIMRLQACRSTNAQSRCVLFYPIYLDVWDYRESAYFGMACDSQRRWHGLPCHVHPCWNESTKYALPDNEWHVHPPSSFRV